MTSRDTHDAQRVFIVDDEPSLRDLFSVALEEETREVVTCGNGFSALRVLAENSFDVILLDLSLPDTNGVYILREMRRRGDNTKVILCSAHVDERSFWSAMDLGVAAFISKPVTLMVLRQIVSDVLAGRMDEAASADKFAKRFGFLKLLGGKQASRS